MMLLNQVDPQRCYLISHIIGGVSEFLIALMKLSLISTNQTSNLLNPTHLQFQFRRAYTLFIIKIMIDDTTCSLMSVLNDRRESDGLKVESLKIDKSNDIRIGNEVSITAPLTFNIDTMHFNKHKDIGKFNRKSDVTH